MVPIDFYRYKIELRRSLLARSESLANEWDPFVAAWVCYALSAERTENNRELIDLHDRMLRWIEEEKDNLWERQRNFGPIAMVVWLCRKRGQEEKLCIAAVLFEKVKQLSTDDKWSPLRDPEQVYLLALGSPISDGSVHDYLKDVARREMRRGPLARRILYAAALRELGENAILPRGEPQDAGDIVALVWWAERYGDDKHGFWEHFSNIKDHIALEDKGDVSSTQRVLSVPEIARLYEAVVTETINPDPVLLFDYFPFHNRIRQAVEDYFKNGKYVSAVFEATKILNDEIQKRTGIVNKSEAELVQATMKNVGEPSRLQIRFNDYLNEDSGKSEQAGLASICEGIFKAFRNPKGHKPENHKLVQIDAYEAFEQLIIIDYLIKRIERAKVIN